MTNVKGRRLIDLVFSWSINDVLNNDLYRGQVKHIPETFSSEEEYLKSFITPLIEETRADLSSSMTTVSESLCCEIEYVVPSKDFKPPKALFYTIGVEKSKEKSRKYDDDDDDDDDDEHEKGDLIAITNVRPKCINDLDRPGRPYLIALILGIYKRKLNEHEPPKVSIVSSKPIVLQDKKQESETLFAVKLANLTTNLRIWDALNSDLKVGNMNIIQKVLQAPFLYAENCSLCHSGEKCSAKYSDMEARMCSSGLNESQQAAILSCIATRECHHQNTVKLIWGPPGTGKTKTVGFLLHSLVNMKCRTLTCAPTNIAVLEVTKRLVNGVFESSETGYGLGDVVLFGNKKRMKIKNHQELYDVFLDHRVDVLYKCFSPSSGWNHCLLSMIFLLENPEKQYLLYLTDGRRNNSVDDEDAVKKDLCVGDSSGTNKIQEGDTSEKSFNNKGSRTWKQFIASTLKENRKKYKKPNDKQKGKDSNHREDERAPMIPLTFGEYVKQKFNGIAEQLYFCIENLYVHLPTSLIPLKLVDEMFEAYDSLKSFQRLLLSVSNEVLNEVLKDVDDKDSISSRGSSFWKLRVERTKNLLILKSLPSIPPPYSTEDYLMDIKMIIREFCLQNARLVFCTVSSSAKLHKIGENPFELLIIDEAAQLKECESTIPLQLSGVRHAILIGDERQLPAMVKSKISDEALFGRSLFERLAILGHEKHLLNVQHRMHPSISLFPNKEFYDNQILDGENVKLGNYSRSFLPGEMYGSYSFINVPHGKEEFDNRHSKKNMVEVAVVSDIVASLYKEFMRTKKRTRVGVISPYKAQVHAISEKVGKQYSSDAQSDFSLSIRSVDGFQGGEEDVIIISAVRCNVTGSVGFLSNRQRTNVALTRARYCLWIVGNATTLGNGGSVWKNLIIDAKDRSCFHNAEEDKNLAHAIVAAMLELNQFNDLINADSFLFRSTKWKVCFTHAFWRSMRRIGHGELFNKVLCLLEKLSNGWRQPQKERNHVHSGSSSLFVEHYKVNEQLYLVWAVDILREGSHYTQVLKVWDILPLSYMPKLSNQLDSFYGSYTVDRMSRCKHTFNDGSLVVPMRWPMDSSSFEADPPQSLSKPLGSLSLMDKPETSSTFNRFRNHPKPQKNWPNLTKQKWRVVSKH